MKRDDNYNCEDYLNWNILNGKCSKTAADENLGTATKPCELTIKSQADQAKNVFDMIIDGQINLIQAFKIMKTIKLNGDVATLTIGTNIAKRDVL